MVPRSSTLYKGESKFLQASEIWTLPGSLVDSILEAALEVSIT